MIEWVQPVTLVLLAVATGIAGFAAAYFAGLKKWMDARAERWVRAEKRRDTAAGFAVTAEYVRLLEEATRVGGLDRLIVFVGRNGGGVPTPGQPYKVRADWTWTADRTKRASLAERYNFPLRVDQDRHYCSMLQQILTDGVVVNTRKDLPSGCLLRGLYEEEGVVQSLLYLLRIDRDREELFYLSAASYSAEFTAEQLVRLKLVVARLQSLMNGDC